MYQSFIREIVAPRTNRRWVEAFMRLHNGCLDHLGRVGFIYEVRIAEACIEVGGDDLAEEIAVSMGM